MSSRGKRWWLFHGLYEFWFCFHSFSILAFIEGRKMFWSCALLNLVLTDGEELFEAPEIWSEPWRKAPQDDSIHDYRARGLARAIYFWKKGQAHHLECFIKRGMQKRKVILLLYLALLLCSILVFAFGKVYGDSGEGPAKISKSDVRNGDQLLREGSVGSGLFNLEKRRLRGDLTVFKYLKGYYIEDAEQMFFTSTGEQIKGNSFKL